MARHIWSESLCLCANANSHFIVLPSAKVANLLPLLNFENLNFEFLHQTCPQCVLWRAPHLWCMNPTLSPSQLPLTYCTASHCFFSSQAHSQLSPFVNYPSRHAPKGISLSCQCLRHVNFYPVGWFSITTNVTCPFAVVVNTCLASTLMTIMIARHQPYNCIYSAYNNKYFIKDHILTP